MQKLRDHSENMEGCLNTLDDVASTHITAAQHAAKLEDLENRLSRNNVRAIGIPEKIERKNPVTFIKQWLFNTFGKDSLSSMFSVERAHRVPACPLPPDAPPRPFLFKMLNYNNRDIILSKAEPWVQL